jgi:GNAT superfamily N-acetyltransferase
VEIRRERYDADGAQRLARELGEELLGRYDGVDGAGAEPPAADFEPPDGVFLVGSVEGAAVACGGISRYDDETGELRRMYVAPAARGRGLARALLEALEREAAALGYRRVRLETGDRQPEAIALYISRGYAVISRYGPYVDDERSVCFERRLP